MGMRRHRIARVTAAFTAVAAVAAMLAGCGATHEKRQVASDAAPSGAAGNGAAVTPAPPSPTVPLRRGERHVTLWLPTDYRPAAPSGGTDDYRCFLLDPKLTPADAESPGVGWTCFGGAGLPAGDRGPAAALDAAPWVTAWAPGGPGERLFGSGTGVRLRPGSRLMLQMHYNLLHVSGVDRSGVRLRLASGAAKLQPLQTMLLPAPVELPCAPAESGPLCDRDAAVADVARRFGTAAEMMVSGLQFICGGNLAAPKSGATQSCNRRVAEPATIRAVAGHMHLLGKSIKIELNPGTARARTLLDIRVWNFDDQGTVPLAKPVRVIPGDQLRVTCTHDASLRSKLPELRNQQPRYVVWGEGTSDEMCLGIVVVTRP